MIEAGVLIGLDGEPCYWHLPAGRSGGSLPDSPDLWDIIWARRDQLQGFAHSHPGTGMPYPSITDLTTFAAIEAALGRRWDWWITSADALILLRWIGPKRHDYARVLRYVDVHKHFSYVHADLAWVVELRRLSGITSPATLEPAP